MTIVPEILAANERYAAGFEKGDLASPPARKVAVLTCMDARIDPARSLGLEIGDAHVIRNAGGRASADAIRSLIISQQLLGTTEVVIMHHTECGMLTFQNEDLRAQLAESLNADASDIDFLPFSNVVESVHEDVEKVRRSPFIPDEVSVSGFIYDVRSGRLQQVE